LFVLRSDVSSSGGSTYGLRPSEAAGLCFAVVVAAKASVQPTLGRRPTCLLSGLFDETLLEISSSMSSVEFHVCIVDHASGYPIC
jgi:hypothetical protein